MLADDPSSSCTTHLNSLEIIAPGLCTVKFLHSFELIHSYKPFGTALKVRALSPLIFDAVNFVTMSKINIIKLAILSSFQGQVSTR